MYKKFFINLIGPLFIEISYTLFDMYYKQKYFKNFSHPLELLYAVAPDEVPPPEYDWDDDEDNGIWTMPDNLNNELWFRNI